jgi:hypothetical protein
LQFPWVMRGFRWCGWRELTLDRKNGWGSINSKTNRLTIQIIQHYFSTKGPYMMSHVYSFAWKKSIDICYMATTKTCFKNRPCVDNPVSVPPVPHGPGWVLPLRSLSSRRANLESPIC